MSSEDSEIKIVYKNVTDNQVNLDVQGPSLPRSNAQLFGIRLQAIHNASNHTCSRKAQPSCS